MTPFWVQNDPKMTPFWAQNDPFFDPFLTLIQAFPEGSVHLAKQGDLSLSPSRRAQKGSKTGPKTGQNGVQNDPFLGSKWLKMGSFWSPNRLFWSQIASKTLQNRPFWLLGEGPVHRGLFLETPPEGVQNGPKWAQNGSKMTPF